MQTVRKRILEILKQRKQATVSELASQLEMAPVSVRYHLDILQGDHLIEARAQRRKGGVGRPTQAYFLTKEADELFPNNFAALTAGLVQQMKNLLPSAQVERAFCALAQNWAAEADLDQDGDGNLPVRLDQVVAFLNERGYFACWEEDAAQKNNFLIHTHNCPYAGVAAEHSELCCMDLALVKELTGLPCERVDAVADGGDRCTYRLVNAPIAEGAGNGPLVGVHGLRLEEMLPLSTEPVTHPEH